MSVYDCSHVGGGFPDLLVARRRALLGLVGCSETVLTLLEVKDGAKPPSARRLTAQEERFAADFPVTVVLSLDDAFAALGIVGQGTA